MHQRIPLRIFQCLPSVIELVWISVAWVPPEIPSRTPLRISPDAPLLISPEISKVRSSLVFLQVFLYWILQGFSQILLQKLHEIPSGIIRNISAKTYLGCFLILPEINIKIIQKFLLNFLWRILKEFIQFLLKFVQTWSLQFFFRNSVRNFSWNLLRNSPWDWCFFRNSSKDYFEFFQEQIHFKNSSKNFPQNSCWDFFRNSCRDSFRNYSKKPSRNYLSIPLRSPPWVS